jgi:pimeloyl-ACP methyl ester carboxylesterase
LVLAEDDMMTHPKGARDLQATIAGQRTVMVKSCGHALMAEQPDAVLDALKGFLM